MEEKQSVISTLCALLLSNGKKDGTPLRELKYDYCFHAGKSEIPSFGHKSVVDFLISSGQFILSVQTSGLVIVRVKLKSMSLLEKNLGTEQKRCSSPVPTVINVIDGVVCENEKTELTSAEEKLTSNVTLRSRSLLNMEANSKFAKQYSNHMKKPSYEFTFDELNECSTLTTQPITALSSSQKEGAQEQSKVEVHGKIASRRKEQMTTAVPQVINCFDFFFILQTLHHHLLSLSICSVKLFPFYDVIHQIRQQCWPFASRKKKQMHRNFK